MGADDTEVFSEDNMVNAWVSDMQLLNNGNRNGSDWVPAECDVSIRPGWFYHSTKNDKVRTPENLFDLYLKSVGRGCSFLLNLPPTPQGLIHDKDLKSLSLYKKLLDKFENSNMMDGATITASDIRGKSKDFSFDNMIDNNPETFWSTKDDVSLPWIKINFEEEQEFNIIGLREYLPLGQRVDSFSIYVLENNGWKSIGKYEAIGSRRLIETGLHKTSAIKIIFTSKVCPAISQIGVYRTMAERL